MNCLATAWLRKKNRFEIQVDHRVPVAFREGQGIMAADNSGVVDQNIDPAHGRHRLVDQTAHIILLAEIRLNGVKAAAQRQHLAAVSWGILRLMPTISHPACARPSVIPCPRPVSQPVTMATLPVRSKAFSTIFTSVS